MKNMRITALLVTLFAAKLLLAQSPDDFVTTWKTDNPGSSNSTSITVPTTGGGYMYDVDWDNDGTFDELGITGDVTHDFTVAGTYTIRIRGAFPRIYFYGGDAKKLLDVKQWGSIAWTSMERAFFGCAKLNITATDLPDLSAVTNMSEMFFYCSALNGPGNIGDWNTASVTNMSYLFLAASSFNQPIGTEFSRHALNASVSMGDMLNNCGMDCANYGATLLGWANNPATPSGRSFGATGVRYSAEGVSARNTLITTKGWSINDGGTCSQVPVALCQNVSVSADANCEATVTAEEVNNGSYDPESAPLSYALSPEGPYTGITVVTLPVTRLPVRLR